VYGKKTIVCRGYITLFLIAASALAAAAQSRFTTVWTAQEGENTTHRAAIAYSPDGSLVATGRSGSNTVNIRDAGNGALVRQLSAVNNNANAIAFSPNGLYLATGTGESGQGLSLNLWRVADGERLVGRIAAFTNGTISVSFSPDSELLIASGFHATSYKVYHVPDMTLVSTIGNFDPELGYNVRINAVAFSPDSQLIAVADTRSIKLRNATDGSLIRTINTSSPYAMNTNSVQFSPDGRTVAGGVNIHDSTYGTCIECKLKLFSVPDGILLHTYSVGNGTSFPKLSFSGDGKTIGAGFSDPGSTYGGSAAVWDVATERLLLRDQREFWVEDFAFSPTTDRFAFYGADGVVAVMRSPSMRVFTEDQ
jgi:WD40 repeat protein